MSYGSKTIKIYTNEGVYIRMYGNPTSPCGIAIDDEGYSIVAHKDDVNSLSIYNPQGNEIHTVGKLNNLWGAALDPRDGSVFVVDRDANSVLKYSI